MNTGLAVTTLRLALRDGDEVTVRRILGRPDLPAITVELARLAPIRRPLAPCGTRSAFARHKDRGEPVDEACRDAERVYQRDRKRRQRARPVEVRVPVVDVVAVARACDGDLVALTLRIDRRYVHRDLVSLGLITRTVPSTTKEAAG